MLRLRVISAEPDTPMRVGPCVVLWPSSGVNTVFGTEGVALWLEAWWQRYPCNTNVRLVSLIEGSRTGSKDLPATTIMAQAPSHRRPSGKETWLRSSAVAAFAR